MHVYSKTCWCIAMRWNAPECLICVTNWHKGISCRAAITVRAQIAVRQSSPASTGQPERRGQPSALPDGVRMQPRGREAADRPAGVSAGSLAAAGRHSTAREKGRQPKLFRREGEAAPASRRPSATAGPSFFAGSSRYRCSRHMRGPGWPSMCQSPGENPNGRVCPRRLARQP